MTTITQTTTRRKTLTITRDHILDIWRIEPDLGYGGFILKSEDAAPMRAALLNAIDEIRLCYNWIQRQTIGKRVSPLDHSSYYLKHACEFATMRTPRDYDYVSNGAILCAAMIIGVPYKRWYNSPNARLAIRGNRQNRKLHRPDASWALGYTEFVPLEMQG